MAIDWVTVAAQVVNFLILVFLLKRFLYNPVIRVMDRREQRISDRLERARVREEEAESRAEEYEQAQQALAAERDRRLEAARQEAEESRQRLIDEARAEVAERRQQWRDALSSDQERVEHALHRQVVESVTDIARRVLDDLAGESLEARVVERFLERLENDDDVSRDDLESLLDENSRLLVRSRFELGEPARKRLAEVLENRLGRVPELRVETDDSLICGIAVEGEGQRIGWSIDAYMDMVDRQLGNLLERTVA
ncbi:F0F1 ATP synthase subunit delta [Spiribacter sp. 221]|uniref:F0F1 ATP synthase subunit delta n=1 Tax=Spiribacter onubensis TaxID=3122420 RepID=UPI00349F5FB3